MKIRPHLTDDDLDRSQASITAMQRRDIALLIESAELLLDCATTAFERFDVPVVVLCNVETEEVIPSPLDWEGTANVLRLDASVYLTARSALDATNPSEEVVVLLYHPTEDVLSIYTLAPHSPEDNVQGMFTT